MVCKDGYCVECYLKGEDEPGDGGTMCMRCLHEICLNPHVFFEIMERETVLYFADTMDYGDTTCIRCRENCNIWIYVSLCDFCISKNKKEEENENANVCDDYMPENENTNVCDDTLYVVPEVASIWSRLIDSRFDRGYFRDVILGNANLDRPMSYCKDFDIFREKDDYFSFGELKYFCHCIFDDYDVDFVMHDDENLGRVSMITYVHTEPLCFTSHSVGYERHFGEQLRSVLRISLD